MDIHHLITKLREKGHKITPQRLAICELVLSSKDHPTADQIYKKLKQKFPTISLATVYQTLHLLKDLGLLLELGFPDCSARFDPNISPHIHIICLKCGKIEDYETENLKEQWAKIVKDIGVEPIIQRLDLYIYCDKCKKNQ